MKLIKKQKARFNFVYTFIPFLLCSCQSVLNDNGLIHDRSQDYLLSHDGKALVIPHTLRSETLSDQYVIPKQTQQLNLVDSIAPPGSLALKESHYQLENVNQPALSSGSIEAIKGAILIHQPYHIAWRTVNSALTRQRLPIVESDQKAHYMKVADPFLVEAGVSQQLPLYYLRFASKSNDATLVELVSVNPEKRLNQHTSKRLLSQLTDGIQGKYKSRSLFERLKQFA